MDKASKLPLPIDVVKGLPNIAMVGNRQIKINNFKKLLEYSDTVIRLSLKQNTVLTFSGEKLCIIKFDVYELCITGTIKEIKFG